MTAVAREDVVFTGAGGVALHGDVRGPEDGRGCYRVMLQDKDKVGLYISPGKHGRIHYEKAMKAGKPFPVAMAFGQHPLLYIAASQAVPLASTNTIGPVGSSASRSM